MTAACPACASVSGAIDTTLPSAQVQLSVPSIRCAACISAIEDHLSKIKGIRAARVNLSRRRVSVDTDNSPNEVADALSDIGYTAFPLDAGNLGEEGDKTGRDLLLRMGVAGFAMMNVMLLSVAVWSGATGATRDLFHLISSAIAMPVVLYSAQPFFRQALKALRVGRLNMDVPISLAIILAAAMSLYEALNGGQHAYFDAALSLTFFLLIGRYLEHHTRSSARSAAKELSALEVHTARRQTQSGYETVATDALHVGDIVLVPTGMRVPADGIVLSKIAITDRSFLTGESDPVAHKKGTELNAGEINLGNAIELRVVAVGQDTRLHQIASLVETAENARNSYTSLADRAARVYAPVVHLLAFFSFLGWYFATGDFRHSLNIAIAVLIITCPCALGLAVPAVSTAAIAKLYKLGFLVKSGTALERLAEVKSLVFDKTGTLTQPGFNSSLDHLSREDKMIAKALAQVSNHPLSIALDRHLDRVTPVRLTDVKEVKGAGVKAKFKGKSVALGRASMLGKTGDGLMLVHGKQTFPLAYEETITEGADAALHQLGAQNYSLAVVSGDTAAKTEAIASKLAIKDWHAGATPEEKQNLIADLSMRGNAPCMIGDGLNDTIALSQAHASIAPGSALDAARNSADVVILGKQFGKLPKVFEVSNMAVSLSRQNFAIAALYNAIAIPIAVAGFATPLLAALAMSASSITVLLNAMRLNLIKS